MAVQSNTDAPSSRRAGFCRLGLMATTLGAIGLLGSFVVDVQAEDLYQSARQLRTKQTAELKELAAWCDKQGLTTQAARVRDRHRRQDPYRTYLPVLPTKIASFELSAHAPPAEAEWAKRWAQLRREHATALYDLAKRAARQHRASLGFDLVLAAVAANPDHKPARGFLGYQEYQGEWRTLYEIAKLRADQVWHAKYGWLPKSRVARYDQGQRYAGSGSWITAEEDAKRHENIRTGWVIETEHYSIRTNHSLEAGVALGEKLERLFRTWRQLFVRFYASEAHVIAQFNERSRVRRFRRPPMQVVFFRNRGDYDRTLRATMPGIEKSIGVYVEQTQCAYFFAGEGYDERTLLHEATHQLFHQSRTVAPGVGRRANFWIVEGIAMFMESLRREGDFDVLGGFDDQRLYAAQYRLLVDKFYVPLGEFSTYGMDQIQRDPRIATLYSQAAGQTHFLIYYDGGRYRDALVAYLATVYNGQDAPDTLAKLTEMNYPGLDRQYREFIKKGADSEKDARAK